MAPNSAHSAGRLKCNACLGQCTGGLVVNAMVDAVVSIIELTLHTERRLQNQRGRKKCRLHVCGGGLRDHQLHSGIPDWLVAGTTRNERILKVIKALND